MTCICSMVWIYQSWQSLGNMLCRGFSTIKSYHKEHFAIYLILYLIYMSKLTSASTSCKSSSLNDRSKITHFSNYDVQLVKYLMKRLR